MNFLELCQRMRKEAGISGSGPASVLNQTGIYADIVDWVKQAYIDIQNERHNWLFRQSEYTYNTIADTDKYTTTSLPVGKFKECVLFIYKQSDGKATERKIPYIRYCDWNPKYNYGAHPSAYPQMWTITPQGEQILFPTPDDVYVVRGEGYLKVDELVDNADLHIIPSEYEMAIVYKAMEYWAMDQEAEQERQYDEKLLREQMRGLRRDYLSKPSYGYQPLA